MTAEIIDINAVRLRQLAKDLVQQDIKTLVRTTIKEGPCPACSGAGLLRIRDGGLEPFFHNFHDCHKVDRAAILVCKPCGGTGSEYREIIQTASKAGRGGGFL